MVNGYTGRHIQPEIAEHVLRFHIRANSDEQMDQDVKLQVKAAVIAYLQPFLQEVDSAEEAGNLIRKHLPQIESLIEKQLEETGASETFQISIQQEYFPRRTYGDCTFPAGIYNAVVIALGEGCGQNWWCMIYPGLCFLDETYAVVSEEKKEELSQMLTEDAYEWIVDTEHIRPKFRIKWLNRLFAIQ